MESQDFGHEHPLVFNEEHVNQSEAAHECSRCGEVMWGSSFSCAECGFYLHKECAEAPSQLNHPFHRDHPLCLLPKPPVEYTSLICDFCGEKGERFVYHCSCCKLDFHIKCALFTYNIAKNEVGELKHIACKDPSISTENGIEEEIGSAKCFGCWEPLCDSFYYSLSSGLNLHKKCTELPFQINHSCHRKHPLILQLSGEIFPCVICEDTDQGGFFYCCSHCKIGIHVACLPRPPSKDKSHEHSFTLLFRLFSFTCDACGIEGKGVPYTCLNCNLLVHKKCISLPRIIKFIWHEHPIFHTYSLRTHESENWDCVLCREEVNTEHGSYYCSKSDCHFIVHVNCVMKRKNWNDIIEVDEKLDDNSTLLSDLSMNSFTVIERNENGEAKEIEHFSHDHNLMLNDNIVKDDKYCDGCTLLISDSFYYCSQCDFFLHKTCAEFPKVKHLWFHFCRKLPILTSENCFRCLYCGYVSNGFAYKCDECGVCVCLRCATSDTLTCQGHNHPLSFYVEYEGQCNACGKTIDQAFKCKGCKFALDWKCVRLPCKARHKCDQHLLALAYHDDNTYSKSHFCDICEEDRNPKYWFYYCAICDTSAHPKCVLGNYPFMKLGVPCKIKCHPHLVTLVKKMYYYPKCFECDEPCQDLALECRESGCQYIAHWDCIAAASLSD